MRRLLIKWFSCLMEFVFLDRINRTREILSNTKTYSNSQCKRADLKKNKPISVDELVTFFNTFSSALRTGRDYSAALNALMPLFDKETPIGGKIRELSVHLERGSVDVKAKSSQIEWNMFIEALELSKNSGGALAQTVERLARFVRLRESFQRKVRIALSMQRLSAIGIAICSFIILLIQFVVNREMIKDVLVTPMAAILIALGGALIVSGLLLMFRLGRNITSVMEVK